MRNVILSFVYGLYVVYALYASVTVFFRPDDRGQSFRGLRVPIVVLIYFLLPCFALFALYRAFAETYPVIFYTGAVCLGAIYYLILLYFVTSPDWPVGRILGLEKIKPGIIRVALVLNFALASIVLAGSSVTLYLLVPAIERFSQQPVYEKTISEAKKLETAGQAELLRKSEIEKGAIYEIWTSGFGMLEKLFGAIGGVFGCLAGYLALRQSKTERKRSHRSAA
jgi:hypothetical protein